MSTQPPSFTASDFEIFRIGEFGAQIGTMREQVTPKLEAWGEALTPKISELVGHEVFPHVARHLRRRTTPPPETWCAWGPNLRSYKKDPVFGLVASRDGLQLRVMLKHEAHARRKQLPDVLPALAEAFADVLGSFKLRDFYGRDFAASLPGALDVASEEMWQSLCERAAKKTRAFDVGHAFTMTKSTRLTPRKALNCLKALLPIHAAICEQTEGVPV